MFFHRASPGGCCDCGDLEAWHGNACCALHQSAQGDDPLESLPAPLRRTASIVVRAAAVELCDTAARCVTVQNRLEQDSASQISELKDSLHRSEELASPLPDTGTTALDNGGHAAVEQGRHREAGGTTEGNLEVSTSVRFAALHMREPLSSVVNDQQEAREERALAIASWLSELMRGSDSMRRVCALQFAGHLTTRDEARVVASSQLGTREICTSESVANDAPRLLVVGEDINLRLASTPFSVLIVCDAFLTKRIRVALQNVLLQLLVDAVARHAFGRSFLGAYPFISNLYVSGDRTYEDSIFALSVQIFTTPSLVRKALPPSQLDGISHAGVLSVIMTALVCALEQAGCNAQNELLRQRLPIGDAFLESDIVREGYYEHVLRDLEHVLQIEDIACLMLLPPSYASSGLLNGQGRPLRAWLALLSRLQGLDPDVRRTDTHVEFPSARWKYALRLMLNISSTCDLIARRCLQQKIQVSAPQSMPPPVIADPETSALAARHAYRSIVAALLEWLNARHGTNDWQPEPNLDRIVLRFDVSSQPVSVHLPLHRLATQLALRSVAAGLEALPPLFDPVETPPDLANRMKASILRLNIVISDADDTPRTLGAMPVRDIMSDASTATTTTVPRFHASVELASAARDVLGVALCEHPLRALAYCAHVNAGLWRRNGQTAIQTALAYASPPLSHSLRDMDQQAVLLGTKLLGANHVIDAVLRIFLVDCYLLLPSQALEKAGKESASSVIVSSLSTWTMVVDDTRLSTAPECKNRQTGTPGNDNSRGQQLPQREQPRQRQSLPLKALGACATEALTLIIRLISEVPPPVGAEFARLKLRRELVHAIAVSPKRHSEAVAVVSNAAKAFGLGDITSRAVPVAVMTDQLLAEISVVRRDSSLLNGAPKTRWELRPDVARAEYDPTFPRLSRSSHEKAIERVSRLSKQSTNGNRPLVAAPPAAHAEFEPVRADLLRCEATHRACFGAFLRSLNSASSAEQAADAREIECRSLHLATLIVHDALSAGRGAGLLSRWVRRHAPDRPADECILGFILRIRDIMRKSPKYFGSHIYDEGVEWLVDSAAIVDAECAAFVNAWDANLLSRDGGKPDYRQKQAKDLIVDTSESDGLSKKGPLKAKGRNPHGELNDANRKKRDAARKRAIEGISRRQAKFNAALLAEERDPNADTKDKGLNTDSGRQSGGPGSATAGSTQYEAVNQYATAIDTNSESSGERKAVLVADAASATTKTPVSNRVSRTGPEKDEKQSTQNESLQCILCWSRSETDTLCLLGLAQKSCILGRGIERQRAEYRRLSRTFIVRSESCTLRRWPDCTNGNTIDMQEIAKLTRGDTVRVTAMRNGYARVRLLGEARKLAQAHAHSAAKAKAASNVSMSDTKKRLRVSMEAMVSGWVRESDLRPVSSFLWRRWGKPRVHVSTCGHAVHPSCWDSFFGFLLNKALSGEYAGTRCVDLTLGQFMCPLCQAVSNCLLPDIRNNNPQRASTTSSTLFPRPPIPLLSQSDTLARWAFKVVETNVSEDGNNPRSNAPLFTDGPDQKQRHLDATNWTSQLYWGKSLCASLCDVNDGPTSLAQSRLAGVFAIWSSTAYCATMATLVRQAPQIDAEEGFHNLILTRKRGLSAASVMVRSLRSISTETLIYPRKYKFEFTMIRERLSSLLGGKATLPLQGGTSYMSALGAAKPSDIDVETWRLNSDERVRNALLQPLMSWDLSVLLCAFLSLWPAIDVPNIVSILAVGRLAQILIDSRCVDPRDDDVCDDESTGFHPPLPGADAGSEAGSLFKLRKILCEATGRRVAPSAPFGRTLSDTVKDEWLPFLQTARFIAHHHLHEGDLDAMETQVNGTCLANGDELSVFESLRVELGVPSPCVLAQSEIMCQLLRTWGERLLDAEAGDLMKQEILYEARGVDEHDTGTASYDFMGQSDETFEDACISDENVDDDAGVAVGEVLRDLKPSGEDAERETTLRSHNAEANPMKNARDVKVTRAVLKSWSTQRHVFGPRCLDLSRMALASSKCSFRSRAFGFVDLPDTFTGLYTMLSRNNSVEDNTDLGLCLLTGRVLERVRFFKPGYLEFPRTAGACTRHARDQGGVGIYFLVLQCTTLLISGSYACFCGSLYVDEYGEEDVGLRSRAPLRLCRQRLRAIERLYFMHGIADEVARRRASGTFVIPENFY